MGGSQLAGRFQFWGAMGKIRTFSFDNMGRFRRVSFKTLLVINALFLVLLIAAIILEATEPPSAGPSPIPNGILSILVGFALTYSIAVTALIYFWPRTWLRYVLLIVVVGPPLYFVVTQTPKYFANDQANKRYEQLRTEQANTMARLNAAYVNRLAELDPGLTAVERLFAEYEQEINTGDFSALYPSDKYFPWAVAVYIQIFLDPDYLVQPPYYHAGFCESFAEKFYERLQTIDASQALIDVGCREEALP